MQSSMMYHRSIVVGLLLLAAILVVSETTSIDLWLGNQFYASGLTAVPPLERWVIYKGDPQWEFWLHHVPKVFTMVVGLCMCAGFIASFAFTPLRRYRRDCLFLALSLALVALLVSGAKQFTNIYCPNQLTIYGGDKPYVRMLETYPADFNPAKKGRCFPAGHATAGFGFMALYFIFRHRSARIAGLAFGVAFGWGLGLFQMLRGEHFLSHTLFSMVASWVVILIVASLFDHVERRSFTVVRSQAID